jgi:hypothetical protein
VSHGGVIDAVRHAAAPYVLVAIQDKETDARDSRYDAWSGEERFLRSVADHLRERRFRWSKL